MKKQIKNKNTKPILLVLKHLQFIKNLEKNANFAYEVITEKMTEEILRELKKEKLVKSDNPNLIPKNWQKDVPRIEINLNEKIVPIIERYMAALRYALLGKAAGPETEKIVSDLGLEKYLPKGALLQGFFDAVDVQNDYFSKALKLPKIKIESAKDPFLEYTFNFIQDKTARFLDKTITELKTKTLNSLDNLILEHNQANLTNTHKIAHSLVGEMESLDKKKKAVKDAIKAIAEKKLDFNKAKQALRQNFDDYATNWDLVVKTEVGMASSVATSQTIMHHAGPKVKDVIVTIVSIEDDRVSNECKNWSRNKDGSLKYFKLTSLKPPGYNLGHKKAEWENCQPLRHFRCRCTLVYVPKGYKVDNFGSLVKLQPEEEITIENA